MTTRKERSLRNREAHAAERSTVLGKPAPDPLDEEPMAPRPPLTSIPWNKVALTDEQRQAVAEAVLAHYPRNEIARALGVTVKTLKRLLDQEPELTDAVDAAREAEEAELRDCLMRSAKRGSDVAALFLLKSRHGYVDRTDNKPKPDEGRCGVLVVPGTMDTADFERMAFKQQAPFRERQVDGGPGGLEPRTRTNLGGGMSMQRLLPGDRPN